MAASSRLKLAVVVLATAVLIVLICRQTDGINGPDYWRWPWRRAVHAGITPYLILLLAACPTWIAVLHFSPSKPLLPVLLMMGTAAALQAANRGLDLMPFDLTRVLSMRLSEHALHTWDIAVTLDPAARVAPDAVDLLVDRLGTMVGFMGKQAPAPVAIAVTTTSPERALTLDTGGVTLAPAAAGDAPTASLALPAEAFLRLIYGRLDDATEVTASGVTLPELKSVFPGF